MKWRTCLEAAMLLTSGQRPDPKTSRYERQAHVLGSAMIRRHHMHGRSETRGRSNQSFAGCVRSLSITASVTARTANPC